MKAQAMRSDLEAFLNKALQEGWRGWPAKAEGSAGSGHMRHRKHRLASADCHNSALKGL
jgi:hypothetical protein